MYYDEEEHERYSRRPKTKVPAKEQFDQTEPGDSFEMPQTPPSPEPARPRSRAPRPPRPEHHHTGLLEDKEEGFFAKHRIKFIIGGALIAVGAGAFFLKPGTGLPTKPTAQVVSIRLPPLPPPPPPPKPKVQPLPPKEQKMMEQAPVAPQEKPAEQPKPKAAAPLAPLGTGLKGDGPGLAGLGGSGEGGGLFGGTNSGGGGSKWGWYAGQVQTRMAEAVRRNKTASSANIQIKVRIWADSTGRITRAKMEGSSGHANVDQAIQNEVLAGLQLNQPPPPGMPMPIVMRLSVRQP